MENLFIVIKAIVIIAAEFVAAPCALAFIGKVVWDRLTIPERNYRVRRLNLARNK